MKRISLVFLNITVFNLLHATGQSDLGFYATNMGFRLNEETHKRMDEDVAGFESPIFFLVNIAYKRISQNPESQKPDSFLRRVKDFYSIIAEHGEIPESKGYEYDERLRFLIETLKTLKEGRSADYTNEYSKNLVIQADLIALIPYDWAHHFYPGFVGQVVRENIEYFFRQESDGNRNVSYKYFVQQLLTHYLEFKNVSYLDKLEIGNRALLQIPFDEITPDLLSQLTRLYNDQRSRLAYFIRYFEESNLTKEEEAWVLSVKESVQSSIPMKLPGNDLLNKFLPPPKNIVNSKQKLVQAILHYSLQSSKVK
ncbi:MAG: hypothetical protein ACFE0O_14485 [Opitutales bacterium]